MQVTSVETKSVVGVAQVEIELLDGNEKQPVTSPSLRHPSLRGLPFVSHPTTEVTGASFTSRVSHPTPTTGRIFLA